MFLSDVETDPWSEAGMKEVVSKSDRLIVTRGELGANEHNHDGVQPIPVLKVCALECACLFACLDEEQLFWLS